MNTSLPWSCLLLALLVAPGVGPGDTARGRRAAARRARGGARAIQAGTLERALSYIERNRIVERLSGADGFYPRIGSVQRGGGFAFGGGYRKPFASGHLVFNAEAAMTMKGYRVVGVELSAPRLLSDRLTLIGRGRYRYFPQEDYFGLGPGSGRDAPVELPPRGTRARPGSRGCR